MPWKETQVMDQRTEFMLRALRDAEPFGDLCREFGISRKTGYKWKQRFFEQGLDGLADRSRRPASSPGGIDEDTICYAVKIKTAHPNWGARKIREVMVRARHKDIPSESSLKRIFDKAGLTKKRRRRKTTEQGGRIENRIEPKQPNQVWTIDFKGWWYTRDRKRFEPLTIRDDFSRYVLCAKALDNSRTETVRAEFERTFERRGLPEVIRSDNGTPFAAVGSPLGLSRLSTWWLTLGIDLDRIKPGRPDQNGGHERMHRDMAVEVEGDPEIDRPTQQATLDVWRKTFNYQRPHEAIGMRVPADLYEPSTRSFEPEAVELCYPENCTTRKVGRLGFIKLRGEPILISAALAGYEVGLEPLRGDRFSVWFCRLCLGEIDFSARKFRAVATK